MLVSLQPKFGTEIETPCFFDGLLGVDPTEARIVLPLVAGTRDRLRGSLQDAEALRGRELRFNREHQCYHAGDVRARHARAGHFHPLATVLRKSVRCSDVRARCTDVWLQPAVSRWALAAGDV